MLGANQMGVTNGEKMNLQVGGPTNTIVLTENRTGVTLIMDLTLYQLGHAFTTHRAKLVFEIIDLAIIVCFPNIVRNIDINVKSLYYLRSNNRFQWWESILPLFK